MLKNFTITIPVISSLIFGSAPFVVLAKGGQFEISVVAKGEVKNAVAEIGGTRVSLGDLRPGEIKNVKFPSSKRLSTGVPVRILSSGFFGDKVVSEKVVAGSFRNPAPDPGCAVASDYRARISVLPGSAILSGGTGELVVGVGPDTRAQTRSLALSLSKSGSGSRRISDPVILESLRRAPTALMFTGSAEEAVVYMINKNGSLARKSSFYRETVDRLSASYDRLGVKNVAEVMGIPSGTGAAVKEALSRVTNLDDADGYAVLISPPSAGENMQVLVKRSAGGQFEPLGEIGSANFQIGYIQAGKGLHVFVSEAPLTQGIVSRELRRNSASISNAHDAGHKILSLGWLSINNVPSRQLTGWRLINLALAQDDIFFDDVSLVAAEIVSNPPPAAWSGGDAPPAPAAPASTGASPIIPPLTGSSASGKKDSSGFGVDINVVGGVEIKFGGSKGAEIGPFIGGVPRDSGFGPATDPFSGGRVDAPLGPGFTIQGEGSALDKCYDGKFDRKGGGLQPPKREPTELEKAFREGLQTTGASRPGETGAVPGPGAGVGFSPPTPRSPIVTPGGTGFAPPPTPVSEDDVRGGILDRVLQIFTR